MSKDNHTSPGPLHQVVGQMRDERNCIRYIAKSSDEHSHSVTLTVFEVQAWECDAESTPCEPFEEVAVFYVKWDGCAHIGFRSPDLSKQWVHVCGVENMRMTLRMLEWAWDLAVSTLRERGFDDTDLAAIRLPIPSDQRAGASPAPSESRC